MNELNMLDAFIENQDKLESELWDLIDLYAKGDPNGDIQEDINMLLIELTNDCYLHGLAVARYRMANAI